jgi:hypothetical protein
MRRWTAWTDSWRRVRLGRPDIARHVMTKCVKPLSDLACYVVPLDQLELPIWTT